MRIRQINVPIFNVPSAVIQYIWSVALTIPEALGPVGESSVKGRNWKELKERKQQRGQMGDR